MEDFGGIETLNLQLSIEEISTTFKGDAKNKGLGWDCVVQNFGRIDTLESSSVNIQRSNEEGSRLGLYFRIFWSNRYTTILNFQLKRWKPTFKGVSINKGWGMDYVVEFFAMIKRGAINEERGWDCVIENFIE